MNRLELMATNFYDLENIDAEEIQKPASAVDIVIDYIRTQIFQRKLRKGDKLPSESEMCDLLNVGRGSVREAMKRLEAVGLLEIRRGDGTYVSSKQESTTFDALIYKIVLEDIDFEQILEYRIQLEISILQLAIKNCTPELLERLYKNCDTFEAYVTGGGELDPEVLHNLDMEFHRLLGKAAHNRLLSDVYRASLDLFSPYILRNYQLGQVHRSPLETVNNHKIFLNAIERRDVNMASYAVINATDLWNRYVKEGEN